MCPAKFGGWWQEEEAGSGYWGTSPSLCHGHLWTQIRWQGQSLVEASSSGQHQNHITSFRKNVPFWAQEQTLMLPSHLRAKAVHEIHTVKVMCQNPSACFHSCRFKNSTCVTRLWHMQAAQKIQKFKFLLPQPPAPSYLRAVLGTPGDQSRLGTLGDQARLCRPLILVTLYVYPDSYFVLFCTSVGFRWGLSQGGRLESKITDVRVFKGLEKLQWVLTSNSLVYKPGNVNGTRVAHPPLD